MESKTLFNFYLDDTIKKQTIAKLTRLNGEQEKGQLASLLRVMLKLFIEMSDEESFTILNLVKNEYITNLVSNKRSRM